MRTRIDAVRAAVLAGVVALGPAGVSAQDGGAPGLRPEAGLPAGQMPGPLASVAFEQRLDQALPLDVPFVDEDGREVTLGRFFGRRPVVLAFVYYECPMLCNQVLNGLTSALAVLDETVGRDFDVVAISFDARETPLQAAAKRKAYLERYARAEAAEGWHFLTGSEASIQAVTRAAGFRYAWDPRTEQFAHASGIVVATPEGRLSRYFFGIEYAPRDVQFALIDSSNGRIGGLAERVVLYCYHYDPAAGTYAFDAMRAVRIGGALTLVAVVGFVVVSLRRERREAAQ